MAVIKEDIEAIKEDYRKFAYIVSHDFTAPFRQIQGFTSLIKKNSYKDFDEKTKSYFDMIIGASEKCQQTMDALLKFSRTQVDPEKFENINSNEMLQGVSEKFYKINADKNIEISISDLPEINADKGQLEQVFFQLIDNSIKFSKEGESPKINISGSIKGDKTLFSIKDNGIGIKENFKEQVFDMLRKGGHGEEYEGLGVGLTIAKKIINQHGGKIWIERSDESGLEISFSLPT